jgi:aryl-alcohol dehydrogenase-like predicted oxidoreductase
VTPARAAKAGGSTPAQKGSSAPAIRRAAEDSLRRLGTDRISLYVAHVDDPDTPLEKSLGASTPSSARVRYLGASNAQPSPED